MRSGGQKKAMKILLIEDDVMLARALDKALSNEGFRICVAQDGKTGIIKAFEFEPELVILDLGLPDMDGVQVLKRLRQDTDNVPVLILTARDTVYDKVSTLDSGADDYLAKPFDMLELLARIRVLARRIGTAAQNLVTIGRVRMDMAGNIMFLDDQKLTLTRKEYLILKALMLNVDRILTKEMIERKLYDWSEEVSSNTVEVHISNLRKKLPTLFIKTIRGIGYSIENPIGNAP